ncbi:tRNA pseudouridine(13) synthase TruD [Candidatus Bathyarchaeota archaeon]|nr:tRNA pseudouridine(13) synthase TruD [Candidatus Bathyarchaeota archaeon]
MINPRFSLGGRTKVFPEDFVVDEIWKESVFTTDLPDPGSAGDAPPSKQPGTVGEYLHFTLVKKDWTTVKLLQVMSDRLHVSLKRFGFSGMKDKRALTAQRISVWHLEADRLGRLRVKDAWVKDLGYSNERITLGQASGNRFTVTIRDISHDQAKTREILEGFEQATRKDRIPNFFGEQRLEGGNVEVGNAIVAGDLKQAVDTMLLKVQSYLGSGLDSIPDVFWTETRVLQHLQDHPNDYAGALRRIPKKILRIFTHSVQSQSFNDALMGAIQKGEVPEKLEIGGFPVPRMPELSTISIQRNSYLSMTGFEILRIEENIAQIRFSLGTGEYATTMLSQLGVETREKRERTD